MIKTIITKKYAIMFNMEDGMEILTGINGNPDPFSLEAPSMIDVGIMGHCKNKCSFCYQGDKNEPNMTLDDFKLVVDQCHKHVNQMALGGRGDPNHHENFEEIVRYARENNIIPNYTTSGIDLTDEQIEITKKYCGAVAVSAYAKPYTYDAITRFTNAGVKTNIHYMVTRHTIYDAMLLMMGKNVWGTNSFDLTKVNAVVFLLYKQKGRGKNLDINPIESQLEEFIRVLRKPKTQFKKIGLDSCLFNKIHKLSEPTAMEKLFGDTCEGSRMSCYITPDLRLIPCSFEDHDKAISIKGSSIKEIWKSSQIFNTYRDILGKDNTICPACCKG